MSIHTAMLAGTSGLRANASALAVASDNISNANTVGYKRTRSDFSALVVGQSAQSSYNAAGVVASQAQEVQNSGTIGTSSLSTHLAVDGEGLFVTREAAEGATAADQYYFTRDGRFEQDSEGYLQNISGYYLHGWPVGADGSVTAGASDLGALEPVRVTGVAGASEPTENMSIAVNLQASQEVSATAGTYDLATTPAASMASGAFTPDFQTTVQMYDSLGGVRTVAFSFLKSTTPNQWFVESHVVPATDMQGTGAPDGRIASGTLAFTPSGSLDTANTTFPSSVTIGNSATVATDPAIGWATGLGLDTQTINLDLAGAIATGGVTQFDDVSAQTESLVDGLPFGVLSTFEIDNEGYVKALFSNGMSRDIYKIPLATFSNYAGLNSEAGGAWTAAPDAGGVTLLSAGESGPGEISSGALEASTVDLADEFTNLITIQRAYSASSKIITTSDEMLDELIRLKR